jgi:hypothetical protein
MSYVTLAGLDSDGVNQVALSLQCIFLSQSNVVPSCVYCAVCMCLCLVKNGGVIIESVT